MQKYSFWNLFKVMKKPYLLYGTIVIGFIVWMIFLDTHSWGIHSELNGEIEKLELEKKALIKIISDDKNTMKQLKNKDSLERFAREQYGHKKKNEIIFIIETTESPNNN